MRKHKKSKKGILKRAVFCIAAVAVVCVFVNQYSSLRRYDSQIAQLEQDIADQQQEGQQLSEQESAYTSMDYIEQVARETLGLVRADEKIYIDSSQK